MPDETPATDDQSDSARCAPAAGFGIDLHVHTRRYSPCAETLDPELLAGQMRRRRLAGVVLTEHDTLWQADELAALNGGAGDVKIYRGVEMSCREGHFLVIGLDRLPRLEVCPPVERLLAAVDSSHVAVILAHPYASCSSEAEVRRQDRFPDGIHAVEVSSTQTVGRQAQWALALAKERCWHPVGGSDAHNIHNVGAVFTRFDTLPADERELAAAIRRGEGRPVRCDLGMMER